MQAASSSGTVKDLKITNKVVEYALNSADRGLSFKSDAIDWNNMVLGTVTDASHANEDDFRSQGARLQILATPSLLDGNECKFHLIGWSSTVVRRVCRATVQSEAYSLQQGVEEGDRLRGIIADLRGLLKTADWETAAAASMKQVWITDCKSVEQVLLRPVMSKMTDKRLSIEIASLRQSLWRTPGMPVGNPEFEDERPKETTDIIRWIDTDVMLADPLTKAMDCEKLNTALENNYWNIEQPIESVLKKRAKQLARRKTQDADTDDLEQAPVEQEEMNSVPESSDMRKDKALRKRSKFSAPEELRV